MLSQYKLDFIINYKNKEINYNIINNIFKKYHINFKIKNNIDIFIQALTHKSFSILDDNYEILKKEYFKENKNKVVFIKNNNYERLEFLGDAIIKPIISIYLFNRYPYEGEGFLSPLRTKIESTNTLSHFFKCLNLQNYILLSLTEEQNNGRDNIKILEDCFEAFIGALYIYSTKNNIPYGDIMDVIQKLINTLIENELDMRELIQMKDYKGELNVYCHKNKIKLAEYITNKIDHCIKKYDGQYTSEKEMYEYNVSVIVNGKTYGPCTDVILKEAQQKAAKLALDNLKKTNDEDDDIFYVN